MANMQTGKCGFFVDWFQYLHLAGVKFNLNFKVDNVQLDDSQYLENLRPTFSLDPYRQKAWRTNLDGIDSFSTLEWNIIFDKSISAKQLSMLNYFSILGHNMFSATNNELSVHLHYINQNDNAQRIFPTFTDSWGEVQQGATAKQGRIEISQDGFSISTFKADVNQDDMVKSIRIKIDSQGTDNTVVRDLLINSMSLGFYYRTDREPQIGDTVSFDMSHFNEEKTKGGFTTTFTNHTGRPWFSVAERLPSFSFLGIDENGKSYAKFEDREVFEGVPSNVPRRSFTMTFPFHDNTDIFADGLSLIEYEDAKDGVLEEQYIPSGETGFTDTHGTFYTYVIRPTMNGQLPFIFCTNIEDTYNGTTRESNFMVARFKSDSLSFTQSAPNLYNVNLDIEESW